MIRKLSDLTLVILKGFFLSIHYEPETLLSYEYQLYLQRKHASIAIAPCIYKEKDI